MYKMKFNWSADNKHWCYVAHIGDEHEEGLVERKLYRPLMGGGGRVPFNISNFSTAWKRGQGEKSNCYEKIQIISSVRLSSACNHSQCKNTKARRGTMHQIRSFPLRSLPLLGCCSSSFFFCLVTSFQWHPMIKVKIHQGPAYCSHLFLVVELPHVNNNRLFDRLLVPLLRSPPPTKPLGVKLTDDGQHVFVFKNTRQILFQEILEFSRHHSLDEVVNQRSLV